MWDAGAPKWVLSREDIQGAYRQTDDYKRGVPLKFVEKRNKGHFHINFGDRGRLQWWQATGTLKGWDMSSELPEWFTRPLMRSREGADSLEQSTEVQREPLTLDELATQIQTPSVRGSPSVMRSRSDRTVTQSEFQRDGSRLAAELDGDLRATGMLRTYVKLGHVHATATKLIGEVTMDSRTVYGPLASLFNDTVKRDAESSRHVVAMAMRGVWDWLQVWAGRRQVSMDVLTSEISKRSRFGTVSQSLFNGSKAAICHDVATEASYFGNRNKCVFETLRFAALAHGVWNPSFGDSVANIAHMFGNNMANIRRDKFLFNSLADELGVPFLFIKAASRQQVEAGNIQGEVRCGSAPGRPIIVAIFDRHAHWVEQGNTEFEYHIVEQGNADVEYHDWEAGTSPLQEVKKIASNVASVLFEGSQSSQSRVPIDEEDAPQPYKRPRDSPRERLPLQQRPVFDGTHQGDENAGESRIMREILTGTRGLQEATKALQDGQDTLRHEVRAISESQVTHDDLHEYVSDAIEPLQGRLHRLETTALAKDEVKTLIHEEIARLDLGKDVKQKVQAAMQERTDPGRAREMAEQIRAVRTVLHVTVDMVVGEGQAKDVCDKVFGPSACAVVKVMSATRNLGGDKATTIVTNWKSPSARRTARDRVCPQVKDSTKRLPSSVNIFGKKLAVSLRIPDTQFGAAMMKEAWDHIDKYLEGSTKTKDDVRFIWDGKRREVFIGEDLILKQDFATGVSSPSSSPFF